MKRALAVVAAVAMVVGALWWKGVIGGDGSGGGSSTAEPVRVLCATELAAACEQLDGLDEVEVVRTEDPGTTADALAAGESTGWDAWLVSEPWVAIARDRAVAQDRGLTLDPSEPLASTPLEVLATLTAATTLGCDPAAPGCWSAPSARVGLGPASTTAGALGAVAVAAELAGRPDFATNDYEETDLRTRLAAIASSDSSRPADPVARLLTAVGSFDLAVGLAIRVPDAQSGRVGATEVAPAVRARAVLAARNGSPDDAVERIDTDRLRDAFEAAGWTPVTDAAPASGLPNPAVIGAVAALWDEVRR